MSDYSTPSNETTSDPNYGAARKKIIIISVSLALVLGGIIGFTQVRANAELNNLITEINQSIAADDLISASKLVSENEEQYSTNPKFSESSALLQSLEDSKSYFTDAEIDFSKKDFQRSINLYGRVIKIDEARYAQAQLKIKSASEVLLNEALVKAQNLSGKNQYIEALQVLTNVSEYAYGSAQYTAAINEIQPKAAVEKRQNEAKANAKYISALRSLRKTTDKFEGNSFYQDRSTPYYADNNKFFLYIGQAKGSNPYLRFEVRYSDDDWLFVNSASVNIDGTVEDLDISDDEWKRDNGSGDIWEWADVVPTDSHLRIINDIINSRSAVIRFYGDQYRDDRTISSSQKRGLQNILNAYEALKKGLG